MEEDKTKKDKAEEDMGLPKILIAMGGAGHAVNKIKPFPPTPGICYLLDLSPDPSDGPETDETPDAATEGAAAQTEENAGE